MKRNYSNRELLQDYGILFENLKTQDTLKTELADYGYDKYEVSKGRELYIKAQKWYEKNVKESQEKTSAYASFSEKFEQLVEIYRKDRKKAKIVYRKQDDILKILQLKGQMPRRMVKLQDTIRIFYQTLFEQEALQTPLQRLKITVEHIVAQLNLLKSTEKAYAEYIREKGEGEDATKQKDLAFSELEDWVQEFYSIAKIALEDHPQLLESVAKFVRS